MTSEIICFRLLRETDKGAKLADQVDDVAQGRPAPLSFIVSANALRQVPGCPFAYWVRGNVRRLFTALPPFEGDGRTVRQGLATADDFRFIRTAWEVPRNQLGSSHSQETRWFPITRGGSFSPFYTSLTAVVNWARGGAEIRNSCNLATCKVSSRPQGIEYYFRPGLTWPLRGITFSSQAVPRGVIFSIAGKLATCDDESQLSVLLALSNSRVFDFLIGLFAGKVGGVQYEVGLIGRVPVPPTTNEVRAEIGELATKGWTEQRTMDSVEPTSWAFVVPALLVSRKGSLSVRAATWESSVRSGRATLNAIRAQIDTLAFRLYGLDESDLIAWKDALEREPVVPLQEVVSEGGSEDRTDDDVCSAGVRVMVADLLAYAIGCDLGQWDVRFAAGETSIVSNPADPFDALPVCPPGMLQDEKGLPVTREGMSGFLAAGQRRYPLEIPWDGVLVDDAGHVLDIEARLRGVLEVIFDGRQTDGVSPASTGKPRNPLSPSPVVAESVEREACEIMGVKTLRDYFRKPAFFFADHLKRYSKSRRQAPIYWPLSTPSCSYTLWLYYHRLTDQTLYTCVNDFVDPKLKQVTDDIRRLQTAEGRGRKAEKEYEQLTQLELELKDFRDELLRLAKFWKPNLNDGVQITAAPLWKLFQYRPWQKKLKETWAALEAGKYDWAHLAYSIWPDRVREKCKTDKSLAIAHGLEELYQEPEKPGKKKRGGKK